jgi:hypothetical protein
MDDKVDETNFVLYAAKNYDNPGCFDTLEFYEDLKRIKYIKRHFNKYAESGELKERLILNHIIVLYNVFGNAATKLLMFRLQGHYNYLKPFLIFLNRMPESITGIGIQNTTIYSSDIAIDQYIVDTLRKI